MSQEFEIRQIFTSVGSCYADADRLLREAGLRPESLPYFIGAYDADDELLAVGGLDGNIIKCVAVREEARGTSVSNSIVSTLLSQAYSAGHDNVFVFTKPEYARLFSALSFHIVGSCADAVLLESDSHGIKHYSEYLRELPKGSVNGVIVMNCNPLTLGHLQIIKTAASRVDRLFIIPVKEDKSCFPYSERKEMIVKAARMLDNVTVCEGSPYSISSATFPTYFLKELSTAAVTQMELDCDIFNRHIAPALDVSVRFAGSEPSDPLTATYNEMMSRRIGIRLEVIERSTDHNGSPVSASRVRKAITDGEAYKAFPLVPPFSWPYILAHAASDALIRELELTPKPGLVDLHDNGSHTDMNLGLMRRSIMALRPWFARLAEDDVCDPENLKAIGLQAEKAMYDATNGVNTHKGALFSIGITIAAASGLLPRVVPADLHAAIRKLASRLHQPKGTHGDASRQRYGIPGALDEAKSGYEKLFCSWLPFYNDMKGKPNAMHLLLLKIMSELEDTNIYHRCGAEVAEKVKSEATALLHDFSTDKMHDLNRLYTAGNISPGGAADMLALTLFIDSITKNP